MTDEKQSSSGEARDAEGQGVRWSRNQDGALELRSHDGRLAGGAWENGSGWHPVTWVEPGRWDWIGPPVPGKHEAMSIVEHRILQ